MILTQHYNEMDLVYCDDTSDDGEHYGWYWVQYINWGQPNCDSTTSQLFKTQQEAESAAYKNKLEFN